VEIGSALSRSRNSVILDDVNRNIQHRMKNRLVNENEVILQKPYEKINLSIDEIKNVISLIHQAHLGFILIILAGLLLRLMFISASSNDTSMWFVYYEILASGHILDFYQIMGYSGRYVYPPIWMLWLLTLSFLSPTLPYPSFVVYVKIPIFTFEILTTFVLYSYVFQKTSNFKYALFSSGIFFLNPFISKISAYQTMFDVIGCFFLLCAVYLLGSKKYGWAGIATGLALMTKQYLYLVLPLLVAVMIKQVHWKNLLKYVAGTFFTAAIISVPFYLTTPERYLIIIFCQWDVGLAFITRTWTKESWFPLSGVWYLVKYVAKLSGARIGVNGYYSYLNIVIALYCLTSFAYLIQYRFKILLDYAKVALTASALFILAGLSIHPQYLIFPIVFSCAVITSRRTLLYSILPVILIPYYLPKFFPQLYLLEEIPGIITAGLISAWTIGVVTETFLIFLKKAELTVMK